MPTVCLSIDLPAFCLTAVALVRVLTATHFIVPERIEAQVNYILLLTNGTVSLQVIDNISNHKGLSAPSILKFMLNLSPIFNQCSVWL